VAQQETKGDIQCRTAHPLHRFLLRLSPLLCRRTKTETKTETGTEAEIQTKTETKTEARIEIHKYLAGRIS
jgi:hypothetical protein